MDRNLVQRISVAAVGIPAAVAVIWWGGWALAAALALIAALGAGEMMNLAARKGVAGFRMPAIAAAAVVPLAVTAIRFSTGSPVPPGDWTLGVLAASVIAVLFAAVAWRAPDRDPLASAAVTLFTVLYVAVLPTFMIAIRHGMHDTGSWGGAAMVLFPMVVIWVCDTAAMFGGRAFGGPKLAPVVSPGKTRSGGLSGVAGGMLVAPLFVLFVFPAAGIGVGMAGALAMAFTLSVFGQVGDLAESLFKREAGVKDSSNLIPGHGGILDRFDSIYIAMPVAAIGYHLLGVL